jgi:hypothetical protein
MKASLVSIKNLPASEDPSKGMVPKAALAPAGDAVFVYSNQIPMRDPLEVGVHLMWMGRFYRVLMRQIGTADYTVIKLVQIARSEVDTQIMADRKRAADLMAKGGGNLLVDSMAQSMAADGDDAYGMTPATVGSSTPYANGPTNPYGTRIPANPYGTRIPAPPS